MQTHRLILHFVDGRKEVLEFTPGPPPETPAEESDLKLRLSHAMKEGVLRLGLEGSDLIIFTSALASIEFSPPGPEDGTLPGRMRRVKA
jgi:hypothetical protein